VAGIQCEQPPVGAIDQTHHDVDVIAVQEGCCAGIRTRRRLPGWARKVRFEDSLSAETQRKLALVVVMNECLSFGVEGSEVKLELGPDVSPAR
jgi:hypothetical protein